MTHRFSSQSDIDVRTSAMFLLPVLKHCESVPSNDAKIEALTQLLFYETNHL
jgi:hypothetical protein